MHEFSVMSQLVESCLRELEKLAEANEEGGSAVPRRLVRVESVRIEIGELTMLSPEPLRFAWSALTQSSPLEGAKLRIIRRAAVLECSACGYKGKGKLPKGERFHIPVPVLACPECGGKVSLLSGRECFVKGMRAVVEEGRERAAGRVRKGRDCPRRSQPTSARTSGESGSRPRNRDRLRRRRDGADDAA